MLSASIMLVLAGYPVSLGFPITQTHTHARTYTHTHARTHAPTHARTHEHTHTHERGFEKWVVYSYNSKVICSYTHSLSSESFSDHFHTDAVVPSSDHCCTETVLPSSDHFSRCGLCHQVPPSKQAGNDRLMVMQLQLTNKQKATLIIAYAPTMTHPEEVKDQFYEQLDALIAAVPKSEKLIILGDFTARVGTDHHTWSGVIGQQGTGKCNSNGLLLLQTCTAHELVFTITLFRLPTRNKTTWMHPRSKHWPLIDYLITRKKDASDVRVTKSMCGAECWTDHKLLVFMFTLRIQPQRRPQGKHLSRG